MIRVPLKKCIHIVLHPSSNMFDEVVITAERLQKPPCIITLQKDIEFLYDKKNKEELYEQYDEFRAFPGEEVYKGIDVLGLTIFIIRKLVEKKQQ